MKPIKTKLTLTLLQNEVAWFENAEIDFSIDIPANYVHMNEVFSLDDNCETFWCYDQDSGYSLTSKKGNLQLIIFFNVVDSNNFEIDNIQIFNPNQIQ